MPGVLTKVVKNKSDNLINNILFYWNAGTDDGHDPKDFFTEEQLKYILIFGGVALMVFVVIIQFICMARNKIRNQSRDLNKVSDFLGRLSILNKWFNLHFLSVHICLYLLLSLLALQCIKYPGQGDLRSHKLEGVLIQWESPSPASLASSSRVFLRELCRHRWPWWSLGWFITSSSLQI